jgi:hypothetical protein
MRHIFLQGCRNQKSKTTGSMKRTYSRGRRGVEAGFLAWTPFHSGRSPVGLTLGFLLHLTHNRIGLPFFSMIILPFALWRHARQYRLSQLKHFVDVVGPYRIKAASEVKKSISCPRSHDRSQRLTHLSQNIPIHCFVFFTK